MYLHYLFKKQNLRQLKTNKVSLKVFCEDLRNTDKIKSDDKSTVHKYKANSIFIIFRMMVFLEEILINIKKIKNQQLQL